LVPCRTCSGSHATAPCITCASATSPTPRPTRAALETGPRLPGLHAVVALAALLETLAERAEFDAAVAAEERYRLAE